MFSSLLWIINRSKFGKRFRKVVNNVDEISLSSHNKLVISERFIPMVNHMISQSIRSNFFYIILQSTITVGSILVPALLSTEEKNIITNSTQEEDIIYSHNLYWSIWGLSVAVTLSNAIIQLSSLDKKYIARQIHVSQMKKEGWLFIDKAGDIYEKFKNKNHNDFIILFWDRIENLRYHQIVNNLTFDNVDKNNSKIKQSTNL